MKVEVIAAKKKEELLADKRLKTYACGGILQGKYG